MVRRATSPPSFAFDVFINCPFDTDYDRLFYPLVFCAYYAGFRPRSAKESSNAGEVRIQKIIRIIGECRYGIHDLSRTQLSKKTRLPRFNMPLELGLDLGSLNYGARHLKQKTFLILDSRKDRYEKFISDIKGQDITSHGNNPRQLIRVVRDWLSTESKRNNIDAADKIYERYKAFRRNLTKLVAARGINPTELTFNNLVGLVYDWLKDNPA